MKTKITPVNYTEDLDKLIMDEKGASVIGIERMSVTYIQPADTCSSDEFQTLTITTQCGEACGTKEAEKQEGFYFDITIPDGQHWSVDGGDSLKALIDDFKKRLYQTNEF